MKLSKSITIIVILSFLISSNIFATQISYDGKVSNFSGKRLNERGKLSDADLLIQDRFNYKESIKNDSKTVENHSQKSEPLENDTITLYAYPSSYLTTLPYRLYKCVWSKKILEICDINPKGTFEGELTRYDDCDFDITTGYEKDSIGNVQIFTDESLLVL